MRLNSSGGMVMGTGNMIVVVPMPDPALEDGQLCFCESPLDHALRDPEHLW
jgi:hypothetical protein